MSRPNSRNTLTRRDVFKSGSILAAIAAAEKGAEAAPAKHDGAEVYTRIGVRPFINCTATYTINGGSQMLPEVISAIEQASHYHVNLDELMGKVGDRLAQLLQVEWGIVTAGAAASLTHATAGCIAGTDPEKMQRLPNIEGLKSEVIMPRESRVVYDHAVRAVGAKVIEVNSPAELQAAIGPRTAMIEILGNHFGSAKLDLKDVAPIARKAGVPILVDAAADYLIVPNPYLALGADMVAYSGGKIIRGPQGAGLLVGRRDLIHAAWANAAPHHAIGPRGQGQQRRDRGNAAGGGSVAHGARSPGRLSRMGVLVCVHHAAGHPRARRERGGAWAYPRRTFPNPECFLGSGARCYHRR